LQKVQRPELAAIPDDAFRYYHDAGDQDESDIRAEKGLLPRILGHQAFGLDLLEDRRLLELKADVDGNRHQQERNQERNTPRPGLEYLIAEISTGGDDHRQRHHDA